MSTFIFFDLFHYFTELFLFSFNCYRLLKYDRVRKAFGGSRPGVILRSLRNFYDTQIASFYQPPRTRLPCAAYASTRAFLHACTRYKPHPVLRAAPDKLPVRASQAFSNTAASLKQ